MGSSFTHERSTTFPWVASRTVQMVYDLSELRGSVVRLYQNIGCMVWRASVLFRLRGWCIRCCRRCRIGVVLVGRMVWLVLG